MPNVPPGTEKVKEGIAGSMTTMRLKPSILCLAKFLLPPYNILIIKIPLGQSYIQPSFLNEKNPVFYFEMSTR